MELRRENRSDMIKGEQTRWAEKHNSASLSTNSLPVMAVHGNVNIMNLKNS